MSLWRHFTRGVRSLVNRRAADQDLADELDHYYEQAAAEWEGKGLSPAEARRKAEWQLGTRRSASEEVRDYGWENVVDRFGADVRHSVRRLRAKPVFAGVAVLTLALGIGASTAIFSVVEPVLFEQLPYPDASRVIMIWDRREDGGRADVTFGTFREVLARARSFDALAVMRPWQPVLRGSAEPEQLEGQRVSGDYFRALGVMPIIGRNISGADDRVGAPPVAIISDSVWRRRFAGDPAIIGQDIVLSDRAYAVIGVMPAAFENVLAPADVWTALQYDTSLPKDGREWGHHLRLVSRLRSDSDRDRAQRELDAIAASPVSEFARPAHASLRGGFLLASLRDEMTRDVRPALLLIFGAVALLLVITCVNVTTLTMLRGFDRRREFAVQAALGAPKGRLLTSLVTESLLLAALGGTLGIALAQAAVGGLVAISPRDLPRLHAIGVDGSVLTFTVILTTLVGLGVGIIAAWQITAGNLSAGVQQAAQRATVREHFGRRALVAIEVALAVMLLVGAGLLLRSLQQLFAVPPGFDVSGVLTLQVQLSGARFDADDRRHQFFDESLDAIRAIPGVEAAAFTSQLPLTGDSDIFGVRFESSPIPDGREDQGAFRYAVEAGYRDAMGLQLIRGRWLTAGDRRGSVPVVVINQSFARRRFGDADAVGARLRMGPANGPPYTIVGIVADVKQASLAANQNDAVYMTPGQWPWADTTRWFVIRTRTPAALQAAAVRRAIWSVDKEQPILRVATMEDRLEASVSQQRFASTLLVMFAVAAMVLCAIGAYGVLAAAVAERTREIGVRVALGASHRDVVRLVFRQGMALTAIGIAIGLLGAVGSGRAIASLLFGISELDSTTYASVVALLLSISAATCAIPAWRASRIDPAITLKAE